MQWGHSNDFGGPVPIGSNTCYRMPGCPAWPHSPCRPGLPVACRTWPRASAAAGSLSCLLASSCGPSRTAAPWLFQDSRIGELGAAWGKSTHSTTQYRTHPTLVFFTSQAGGSRRKEGWRGRGGLPFVGTPAFYGPPPPTTARFPHSTGLGPSRISNLFFVKKRNQFANVLREMLRCSIAA